MINTVCCAQNGTVGRIRGHPIVRAVRRSGEMIPVTEIHLVVEMLLAESARIKRKQSVTYTKRKADDPMKIALVTGASSGIGREFARQIVKLYRNLDEIWLVARRTERLQELEKEFSVPVRIFDGDLNRDYIYERIIQHKKSCINGGVCSIRRSPYVMGISNTIYSTGIL